MESVKLYALPELPYDYAALAPHLSADLLRLHQDNLMPSGFGGGYVLGCRQEWIPTLIRT
jgi:hypothetical protein